MNRQSIRRGKLNQWFEYGFLVTAVWIGLVLAISFMETPLRFQAIAASLPTELRLPTALRIGHLVFHALNYVEIAFTLTLLLIAVCGNLQRRSVLAIVFLAVLVATQTTLLFTVLDARTLAIISGQQVQDSAFHTTYVILECVKLVVLMLLTIWLLAEFRNKASANPVAPTG